LTSGVNGVEVADIIQDPSEGEKRYQPGHPDADKEGFVAYPNVNPAEDMVDLLSAQRGYEGNVAAMTAIKDMIQRSIDLMK
jgi:flagellar basal-body rod protein FlgC